VNLTLDRKNNVLAIPVTAVDIGSADDNSGSGEPSGAGKT
jgi:hypothetical protein